MTENQALQQDYLREILLSPVYDVAIETPVSDMPALGARLGHDVGLKREDLQEVRSFKIRGAYHKIHKHRLELLGSGVIAASAGNHAQGVALSASRLGIKATIVMPVTTPEIKVNAVRRLGASVVMHGNDFDESDGYARSLAERDGWLYVPPFDDPEIIAGQATVAKELLAQRPELDAVFVPVGGGGLLAGVAVYVKTVMPQVKVIGVEPEDAACMDAALRLGRAVTLDRVGLFADGVAVRRAGEEPFRLARKYCDGIIKVGSDEICAAIKDIYDDLRAVAEPAGALALAGLKRYARISDKRGKLAAILSGANMNFDTLRYVSERCELGEGREAVFAVTIPEMKGSFRRLCSALGGRAITEFNYRYAGGCNATVFLGISLKRGREELLEIQGSLGAGGYAYHDLSRDELAKLHVRYMIGGRAIDGLKEEAYLFNFPERPGALMKFLDTLGDDRNITLFHYRNHGAATGSVLAGFQFDADDDLTRSLDKIGYQYQLASANRAFGVFLGAAADAEIEACLEA